VTDITAQLQAEVSNAAGGIIQVPPGQFTVSSTIQYPAGYSGGSLLGAGSSQQDYLIDAPAPNASTALVWAGPAGADMFALPGVSMLSVKGISFYGSGGAASCFHSQYMRGRGADHLLFEMCGFTDFAIGHKFGTVAADNNCSDSQFTHCWWRNCGIAVQLNCNQSVNFIFHYASAENCPTFLSAPNGGSQIHFTDLELASCGNGGWVIDCTYVPTVTVRGLRSEQGTKQLVRIVGGRAVLQGIDEPQVNQNHTMFSVTGGTLKVVDSNLVTTGSPTFVMANGAGGAPAAVIIDDVYLNAAAPLNSAAWFGGHGSVRATNITTGLTSARGPAPIADFTLAL